MNDRFVPSPALPDTITDLMELRVGKYVRTLNDEVETVVKTIYGDKDPEIRARFKGFLFATHDGETIEGSLAADSFKAAEMIREKGQAMAETAAPQPIAANAKLASIARALNVVMRRYKQSRKQRKNMLGGVQVEDDPVNDGTE